MLSLRAVYLILLLQDAKPQKQGGGGGGIFSTIGGFFSRKGKNEMILPDDKEPSVGALLGLFV